MPSNPGFTHRRTWKENIVAAFVDPRDAIDYLTELNQANPPVEYDFPTLRIRILSLQEWFEKIDPVESRIPSNIKYKLVPSSSQKGRC
ncbi:ribosome biogenesis GTP-binding protein, putative [Babesia ovata]|uniref:Ribosome biogenesis GTP-binding protein, putative n=1 Tax=Babesia ovata TaxID=189622 RepID=A0A2H6KCA3_9APIC|nr:ribosome biogenesis GTP-binding protein, putative [Babesia ovata]GBE60617.1 ribosome biogenesis GTP-binding protein, putative [Babesia ovata]